MSTIACPTCGKGNHRSAQRCAICGAAMASGYEATARVPSKMAETQEHEGLAGRSDSRFRAGAIVAGRYRLERLLGEGGMGVVWAAVHTVTRKSVALKFVKGEAVSAEVRRRMLREARAASAVRHPNVIEVHDIIELEDGAPVMVMELLAGESLADRLRREIATPLGEVADLLLPVVSAVGTAHALGIVHRDLKPENIYLVAGTEKCVKVLDFGIAKLTALDGDAAQTTGLTSSRTILGTPCYMAPEQAFGEREIDHRADIWALGLILYECLSGVLPTRAENVGQVLKIVLTGGIPSLHEIAPSLPEDVTSLVNRMLSRAPEQRPDDLKEVAMLLERYAGTTAPSFGRAVVRGATSAEKSAVPDDSPLVHGRGKVDPFANTVLLEGATRPQAPVETGKRVGIGAAALKITAILAAAGVTTIVVSLGKWWAAEVPAPPVSATSHTTASQPTAITDLPPPVSANPQALTMYAAALQAFRDSNQAQAKESLERALSIEPSLAAAHLRLAIAMLYGDNALDQDNDHAKALEHYAQAVGGRTMLSDRDQALLQAYEPIFRNDGYSLPDAAARCTERLRDATARYPYDAELFYYLAGLLQGRDQEESLRATQRAIELDPQYAQAWMLLAWTLGELGRDDESIKAADRCLAISPRAADCHWLLAGHHFATGHCEEASERLRTALSSAANQAPGTYSMQASALFALDRPDDTILEIFRQKWATMRESTRRATELLDRAKLDIANGRFLLAEEHVQEGIRSAADSKDYSLFSYWLIEIYKETGRDNDAARVATDWLNRNDSQASEDAPGLLRVMLHAGAITKSELDERLRKLSTPLFNADSIISDSTNMQAVAWSWIETSEEANAALANLPNKARGALGNAALGVIYQLAGKSIEAIPALRRAMSTCSGLDWPREYFRLRWFLGQALEQTGDIKGACGAYQSVLDRWGNAKPKSITAEKSRARMKALGCVPSKRSL